VVVVVGGGGEEESERGRQKEEGEECYSKTNKEEGIYKIKNINKEKQQQPQK